MVAWIGFLIMMRVCSFTMTTSSYTTRLVHLFHEAQLKYELTNLLAYLDTKPAPNCLASYWMWSMQNTPWFQSQNLCSISFYTPAGKLYIGIRLIELWCIIFSRLVAFDVGICTTDFLLWHKVLSRFSVSLQTGRHHRHLPEWGERR